MNIFEHLKGPDIILSLFHSQILDWTHTFGTYCILTITTVKFCLAVSHFQTTLNTAKHNKAVYKLFVMVI